MFGVCPSCLVFPIHVSIFRHQNSGTVPRTAGNTQHLAFSLDTESPLRLRAVFTDDKFKAGKETAVQRKTSQSGCSPLSQCKHSFLLTIPHWEQWSFQQLVWEHVFMLSDNMEAWTHWYSSLTQTSYLGIWKDHRSIFHGRRDPKRNSVTHNSNDEIRAVCCLLLSL